MEYTFVAFFEPRPGQGTRVIRSLRRMPEVELYTLPYPETPLICSSHWLLKIKATDLDNINTWSGLFQQVESYSVKWGVHDVGIIFSPAKWLSSGGVPLRGNNSARHMTSHDAFWYQIQSDTERVRQDSVGIFLTTEMNGREETGPITALQWQEFLRVFCKYNAYFRAVRKLEQLRGQRDNSHAFERLSTEVVEIMQRII